MEVLDLAFIKNKAYPDEADANAPKVFIPQTRSQDELLRLVLEQLVLINKRLADADAGAKLPVPLRKKVNQIKKDEPPALENQLEEEGIRTHL